MPQQVRFRTEKTVEYNENGRAREKLDRGFVYRELWLTLGARLDIAAGGDTTAAANILSGDLWGVVRRIEVKLNGNDVIRSFTGEELQQLNRFWYGSPPRTAIEMIGIVAEANETIRSTLILPFWLPNAVKPIDTALDARLLSDIQIEITWGDVGDVTSATGASWGVDPELDIHTVESFGLNGPFNTLRLFTLDEGAVAVNDRYKVNLPVGNMYRSFLMSTKDSDGKDIVDDIVNVKLVSGSVIFADLAWDALRDAHRLRTNMQLVANATAAAFFPHYVSAASLDDAWTYLDLVTDGYVAEAIDTLGFSELALEFEVTGAISGGLKIIPSEIIPVRKG